MPTPAKDIRVKAYRQILIWPLLLRELPQPESVTAAPGQFGAWLEALRSKGWQPAPTLSTLVTKAMDPKEITYEEMVYFHPPARDFLYGDGSNTERPLQRLRREDVTHAEVQLQSGGPTFRFEVPRVELYLCKPLVALLVVELAWKDNGSTPGPNTLPTVLDLQDLVRRAYPPYFFGDAPCGVPARVAWGQVNAGAFTPLVGSDFHLGREHFAKFTHNGAEPPVAAHWKWLMDPLMPFPGMNKTGRFYQQIEDDRIPGMTYLAVEQPREISEGDFDRLAFCDSSGDAPYPYGKEFLDRDRRACRYDRFWQDNEENDTQYYKLTTRYLCSGYQFVMVRDASAEGTSYLEDHFLRHYFRMGLVAHYHRAALLKFADELAESIKTLADEVPEQEFANKDFRRAVADVQMRFLKFRSRSWFTEVSNQLQGQELFAWWNERLGNPVLFKEVDESSQRLYEALAEHEARTLAKAQVLLGKIAAVSVPIALLLAVWSIWLALIQATGTQLGWPASLWDGFGWVVAAGFLPLVSGWTCWHLWRK